jgi:hypothetical protein
MSLFSFNLPSFFFLPFLFSKALMAATEDTYTLIRAMPELLFQPFPFLLLYVLIFRPPISRKPQHSVQNGYTILSSMCPFRSQVKKPHDSAYKITLKVLRRKHKDNGRQ